MFIDWEVYRFKRQAKKKHNENTNAEGKKVLWTWDKFGRFYHELRVDDEDAADAKVPGV